jgi:hypothetical protein
MSCKDESKLIVRKLVWEALKCCGHDRITLAAFMEVDESTIRNWRDGKSIPLAHHYLMLCRFVESEGDAESFSDDKNYKDFVFQSPFLFVGKVSWIWVLQYFIIVLR